MPQPNRRRFKSHLVNHELRLRLVLDDAIFALIAGIGAVVILTIISNREIGDSLWSAHFSIKETRELLNRGAWIAGCVTFVAVLIFGLWSLIDAHRIAGPMHRLRNLLVDLSQGNFIHEIQFRKRDEFQDVAEAADTLVESLSTRVERLQNLADSIHTAAANGQDVTALATELKTEVGFFRTRGGDA